MSFKYRFKSCSKRKYGIPKSAVLFLTRGNSRTKCNHTNTHAQSDANDDDNDDAVVKRGKVRWRNDPDYKPPNSSPDVNTESLEKSNVADNANDKNDDEKNVKCHPPSLSHEDSSKSGHIKTGRKFVSI